MSILVLGGTGHYGSSIVASLVRRGAPVRVLSRDAARARQILGEGPTIVEGDITSRDAVIRALEGIERLAIGVSAFAPKTVRRLWEIECDAVIAALDEARAAGVSRVVYVSAYDIRVDLLQELGLKMEMAPIKLAAERAISESGMNWTVLGAAISKEIFFAMIRGRRMMVPGGGPPGLPTVARRDLGEIAAEAILRDDLAGRRIRVMGPEALSFPEAARRISAAVGEEIEFRPIPLLPLRIAAAVAGPFYPYIRHLAQSVRLMNAFPQEIVAEIPRDHQLLLNTFDYTPTTLEMEAERWADERRSAIQTS